MMLSNEDFRDLYDAHYPLVLNFVRGAVNREQDAEEIVQDVFVRIARNYGNFRGKSRLQTWILAVARNAIVDFWRKNRTREAYTDGMPLEDRLAEVGSYEGDPLGTAIQHGEALAVRACITQLPENLRLVLLCRIYRGLSAVETAAVLGWTQPRVRVTYSRALRKFRDAWQTSGWVVEASTSG